MKPMPNISGINAATVVNTPKVTGTVTRCAPSIAPASSPNAFLVPRSERSRRRRSHHPPVCPATRIKPNREIASMDRPSALVRKMAPRNATGTPALTQNARRGRRNSGQHHQHQKKTCAATAEQRVQPVASRFSSHRSRRSALALLAERGPTSSYVLFDRRRDVLQVLLAHPGHPDQCGGPAIESQRLVGIGETVYHLRDVLEIEARAIAAGRNDSGSRIRTPSTPAPWCAAGSPPRGF